METATRDSYVTTSAVPVQWGAGKINALNAVKKAIERGTGVENVEIDDDKLVLVSELGNNQYEVSCVGANSIKATIYSLSGQAVVTATAQGDAVTVDASGVNAGIYVLAVEGGNTKYTKKIVVK